MATPKIRRKPPTRTISKQRALEHLIHCATRLIASREDPFAIQLLVQSADKVLIDLAKKRGRPLPFDWGETVKPEYKRQAFSILRETSNFFKHADSDHDLELHVVQLPKLNVMMLGVCIVNYQALFGTWTSHMKLMYQFAALVSPESFASDDPTKFRAATTKVGDMTPSEFFADLWTDPLVLEVYPNLHAEQADDLQDTFEFYNTNISLLDAE